MSGIYILGVGQNTPVYIDLVESCGYKVLGLYHYNNERTGSSVYGYKIVGSTKKLLTRKSLQGKNFALSMGDNKIRSQLGKLIRNKGGSTPNLINPTAYISRFVNFGTGITIHANSSIQAGVSIGNDCVISFNVDVAHNSCIEEACFIAGGSVLGAYVIMKSYSFIGVGSVIISGKVSSIGTSSFVGAGSLVTKDIPDNALVRGAPAKVIRLL